MQAQPSPFRNRDFWSGENLRYTEPYFRLQKCARIINTWAGGRSCDLLDVGCGPATLRSLLEPQIRYFGIDIALQQQAEYLHEQNLADSEIGFDGRTFGAIVAAGFFEYMGVCQGRKLDEIRATLKPDGLFVTTYTNFAHVHDRLIDHSLYNNVKPLEQFKRELEGHFRVEKWFPSSHNWHCSEPRRQWLKAVQLPLRVGIPVVSRLLAVNYFFLCAPRRTQ